MGLKPSTQYCPLMKEIDLKRTRSSKLGNDAEHTQWTWHKKVLAHHPWEWIAEGFLWKCFEKSNFFSFFPKFLWNKKGGQTEIYPCTLLSPIFFPYILLAFICNCFVLLKFISFNPKSKNTISIYLFLYCFVIYQW